MNYDIGIVEMNFQAQHGAVPAQKATQQPETLMTFVSLNVPH